MRRVFASVARTWRSALADADDASRAALAVALAVLTFLSTAIAGLQVDAGIRAGMAGRDGDAIGTEATARDVSAVLHIGTDFGVYRRWAEILFDADWAGRTTTDNATGEVAGGDDDDADVLDLELVSALIEIDRDLGEWAREQSSMLQPPYFDEETFRVDLGAIDAERNIGPTVRGVEERALALADAAEWGGRAGDYVTVLTVIAVALFFLGLGTTVHGGARVLLGGAGLTFAAGALTVAGSIAVRPVHSVPSEAVDAVVEAHMEMTHTSWTGRNTLDESDRTHWEAAIAAADRAVTLAPEYAAAYSVRAEARAGYANDLLMAREPSAAEAKPLLEGALLDFRRYLEEEDDAYAAWWNFGWAAYLAGDPATAIEAADRALELSPDQFTLYLNRALAKRAVGDVDGMRADVRTALDVAARAGLDSNGWFFNLSDYDIGRLALLRPDEAADLTGMQRQIREAAVAQKVGSSPEAAAAAPELESLTLEALKMERNGEFSVLRPIEAGSTSSIREVSGFRLTLAAAASEADVVSVRVWHDDFEDRSYALDRSWPAGEATMHIDLLTPYGRTGSEVSAGDYAIEVFVNGATRGAVEFSLSASSAPETELNATQFVGFLNGGGMTCGDPVDGPDGGTATACLTTGATRDTGAEVIVQASADGAIASTTIGMPSIPGVTDELFRSFSSALMQAIFNDDVEARVGKWISTAAPGDTTEVDGARLALDAVEDGGMRWELTVGLEEAP